MNLNKKFYRYGVFLLLASFLLLSGCKAVEITSKWRDKDITVDAIDNEWQDKQYYDEKTQTSIGICNDNDYLYMCLSTKDTDIQAAVVQQGFIVWLNGKGTKAKQLGIRFPLIEEREEGGQGAPPGGEGGSAPGGQGAPPGQGGPGGGSQQVSLAELKILTSKKDEGTTFTRDDAEEMGIFTSMRNLNNELVYELKVPLKKTAQTPYAVMPSELNIVGVGFMIYSTTTRSASGISGFGGSMSDMSSGGMGGGGGGMGGGMGGGGGGFDMTSDSSFNIKDNSGMNNIYSFFGISDDDASDLSNDDVSIINAQPGGGGGMGGGMGGGDMGGGMGDMGGGMGGTTSQTKLEVWCKVTLATR